ncbi:MAG: L,D-transpeptidase [Alphaproteobacteria bacterium]|nr:L,D-transpeptidase [Alphaproteobacteria bacterium]
MLKFISNLLVLGAAIILSGCVSANTVTLDDDGMPVKKQFRVFVPDDVRAMYGPIVEGPYTLPAINIAAINKKYWRQIVDYPTNYQPGTIIIDTQKRFLYLVQSGGKALRYGVGVGKAGLAFTGAAIIGVKKTWPHWTPTREMMQRNPDRYGNMEKGLAPGVDNPLGARALYLFKNGSDTHFRIHGSHEAWSIGQAMSSGCIRMLNQDVIDLYSRVNVGTKVVVISHSDSGFVGHQENTSIMDAPILMDAQPTLIGK